VAKNTVSGLFTEIMISLTVFFIEMLLIIAAVVSLFGFVVSVVVVVVVVVVVFDRIVVVRHKQLLGLPLSTPRELDPNRNRKLVAVLIEIA
jgi:hypothetical protein